MRARQIGRRFTELALIEAGPQLAPDEIITHPGPHTIAGRKLSLGLESRAVTAGDVWVLDPRTAFSWRAIW